MNKVLIITYYWPPSGGSAVLRWLKFTKYLRDFGWEPVIYTPLNPEPQEIDESLIPDIPANIEVIKTRIIEPYNLYKVFTGKKKNERLGVALMDAKKKKGITGKISLWIRSNLFIPDPRMLWIRPSVRFLSNYIKNHPVDVVITTGPPHSMHLIGLGLQRKSGIKWLADFRDPWTQIDFYSQLSLTRLADQRHRQLERKVLDHADHIITVSPGMTEEFRSMAIHKITTITNGYDSEQNETHYIDDRTFTLVHLGSMPKSRNPEIFWIALADLMKKSTNFRSQLKIRLIGKVDYSVTEAVNSNGLSEFISLESYIPHTEAQSILTSASVLLLFINNSENSKGILTNKFFEYLSAKRPIIGIGPVNGDAAQILKETEAGRMFGYHDLAGLTSYMSDLFNLYSQNLLTLKPRNINKYSRKSLTGALARLLNELILK